jgi:hypothetical protein
VRLTTQNAAEPTFLLQERGLFWWADHPVPPKHFAPDTSVFGELKIDREGRVTLDLDHVMTEGASVMAALESSDDAQLRTRQIRGLLKDSNKRVLLCDLRRHGGRSAMTNVSYEGFRAAHCLVGDQDLPAKTQNISFAYIDVDLKEFEEWLRLGSLYTKQSKVALHTNYHHPKPIDYALELGRLSFIYDLFGPRLGKSRRDEISLREVVTIRWKQKRRASISDAINYFGILQDIFILLKDTGHNLEWPMVATEKSRTFTLYFQRIISPDEAPRYYECITNFIQLRDTFGTLFATWWAKREVFGPGFNLYIATRRGMLMYTEHRFIMLIWGLEAFHRKKYGAKRSSRTEKRIQQIIEKLTEPKDQRDLAKWLRHTPELNLEQRIFETLSEVPLDLDPVRLRSFAKECARDRNDMSHFGEHQDGERTSSEYTLGLHKKSEALSYLFHVLILHEIGLDDAILRWWVNEGFHSFHIKSALVEVGLLPADAIKPPVPIPPPMPIPQPAS